MTRLIGHVNHLRVMINSISDGINLTRIHKGGGLRWSLHIVVGVGLLGAVDIKREVNVRINEGVRGAGGITLFP